MRVIALFPSREILLSIGPVNVYWYGMMYFFGFMAGLTLFPRLQKYRSLSLTEKQIDSLLIAIVIGTLVGSRLGYVFFWDPMLLSHPLQIFAVWEGGMSSHGGIIGIALFTLLFCKKYKVSAWSLADILVVLFPIGLALGRMGNFINQELYGTVTNLPWGIEIPGVEGLRHPTQIYAICKNLTIFLVCYLHLTNTPSYHVHGRTLGYFLASYGVLRFLVEFFRDQPLGYYDVIGFDLSRGQLLTIPVFLVGVGILMWRTKPTR